MLRTDAKNASLDECIDELMDSVQWSQNKKSLNIERFMEPLPVELMRWVMNIEKSIPE